MYSRGWNFSLIDGIFLGQIGQETVIKAVQDFLTFIEQKLYILRIKQKMKMKLFGPETDEVCPICQERMASAIEMKDCPHVYHRYCIIKYIMKGGKKCPMCRKKIFDDDVVEEE